MPTVQRHYGHRRSPRLARQRELREESFESDDFFSRLRRSPRLAKRHELREESPESADFCSRLRRDGGILAHRGRTSKDKTAGRQAPRDVPNHLDALFVYGPGPPPTKAHQAPKKQSSKAVDEKEEILSRLTGMDYPPPPWSVFASPHCRWQSIDGICLAEAYAKTGKSLYESSINRIAQAHSDIDQEITQFVDEGEAILKGHDRVYNSIAWPLGLTRCSDATRRRATVDVHLSVLDQQIKDTKSKLGVLEEEWEACHHAELVALDARDMTSHDMARSATKVKEAFKKQARAIAATKCRELQEVEAVGSRQSDDRLQYPTNLL